MFKTDKSKTIITMFINVGTEIFHNNMAQDLVHRHSMFFPSRAWIANIYISFLMIYYEQPGFSPDEEEGRGLNSLL